jgi:CPA1 family monovalent cation:H+ antiporter
VSFALGVVAIVVVVAAVSSATGRIGRSAPLALVLVGVIGSYLPFVPDYRLDPDLVLIGILPPLLYAASIRTSVLDFRRNRRPIALLSVGLVAFTALAVAVVLHWVVPELSFAAAVALGAVVAPPDAVATTAVARRVGLPRRTVSILEGESLVNDATSLVLLKSATAALVGSVAIWRIGVEFAWAAGGGVLVGLAVATLLALVRKHIQDPTIDTTLSFVAPFVAYLPAEELHASGVLAVVVTGIVLGHKAPVLQSASSRLSERINWATIQFLLENAVFLLIGLQVKQVVQEARAGSMSDLRLVGVSAAVLLTVIVIRPIWVFPATYLPRLIPAVGRADPNPPWQVPTAISWAGMRGVVTLAAAFALPESIPQVAALRLVAFVVVAGTLLIQGPTLPLLVRRLGLPRPDPLEDALQEAVALQRANLAGLARLEEIVDGSEPESTLAQLRGRGVKRANTAWERLGRPDREWETPSETYRRLRVEMLRAERQSVLDGTRAGELPDEVSRSLMAMLDVEESTLDRIGARDDALERVEDLTGPALSGSCDHLREAPTVAVPRTPDGCEECLRDGLTWVHLRMCLTCGHVGCCDSSIGRHAQGHFHDTEHPVMRSIEPGEAWRWCFVDQLVD